MQLIKENGFVVRYCAIMTTVEKMSEMTNKTRNYPIGTLDRKRKHSAWIYIGGISFDLSEGDIICVFSQYGEVVNINLIRDRKTQRSRGFCFLCYEDQRSTTLAVDNLNGIKLNGRTIRVDHVDQYRPAKIYPEDSEKTKMLKAEGCALNSLNAFNELERNRSASCSLPSSNAADQSDSQRITRVQTYINETDFSMPEPAVMYGPAEPPQAKKRK
ncbi:hypothetical protein ACOME3_009285 [Neoechinorhynchus agilis]